MGKYLLFRNGKVFTERGQFEEQDLLVCGTKIEALLPRNKPVSDADAVDCAGMYITPGFIDIHIHGRNGYDVTEEPEKVAASLARVGVTAFLPTTLTSPFDQTVESMRTLSAYIASQPDRVAQAVGIYSEGMYFSPEKSGAQNPAFLKREINISELRQLIDAAGGTLQVVALAPELPGAPDAVAYLKSRNIRVSMAHTNAGYQETMRCVERGLDGVTHTFDGMRGMTHIELGAAGAAVFTDSLFTELIADGYHVNPEFIRILFHFKPLEKIILVSDNVTASGLPAGHYKLGGLPIINEGDRLVVDHPGGPFSLAGSCLRLCDSIQKLRRFTGLSAEQLIPCATVNPAKYIGIYPTKGSLTAGKDADINLFDDRLNLCSTYVKGWKINTRECV